MNTFDYDSESPENKLNTAEPNQGKTESMKDSAVRIKNIRDDIFNNMCQGIPLPLQTAEQILQGNPTWSDLFTIMHEVPSLREQAWEQLLLFRNDEPYMRNYALRTVIINIPEYRGVAARIQMDGNPGVYDLPAIMEYFPAYAEEAWSILLTNDFDTRDYEQIMNYVPDYAEKAARVYVDKALPNLGINVPHPEHLEEIMENFPALRDEAWQKICACDHRECYPSVFKKVIERFPEKAAEAQKMLDTIPQKDR